MRFFRVLPVLSLLLGARASSLDPREPAAHRLDVRDTNDICANLDAQLVVPNAQGVKTAVGTVGGSTFSS